MKIPVVTGPTASGKTAAVLGLAEKYSIEIISADAYQVYKYMNIGTAKPDLAELQAVRHHLIDIFTPDMTYSAGLFFEQAQRCIKDVLERGHIPVVAGGTGMYVETLQKGIFAGPDRDPHLRGKIEAEMDEKGAEYMHGLLVSIDPEFAAKIKTADKTRILRGLEINRQLGMNVADAQREYHRFPDYEYDIFVLTEDRQKIYERINARVDRMFEAGWASEVASLLEMGYTCDMDSFKAIGYREIAHNLTNGADPENASERIKTLTRNFAKRQLTWFRHMAGVKYVDISAGSVINSLEGCIFT
jgi:tRNA dimethylallyltransferase